MMQVGERLVVAEPHPDRGRDAAAPRRRSSSSSAGSPVPSTASWPPPAERARGRSRRAEVEPLLVRQAADDAEQQRRRIGVEPETAPAAPSGGAPCRQRGCAGCRARRCADRSAGFQTFVSMPLRMPTRSPRARAQHAVEAPAELRRLDLARVGRAHRRQPVGADEARLQERDLTVELVARRGEEPGAAGRDGLARCREDALKRDVVDREDRPAARLRASPPADRPAPAPPASRARARRSGCQPSRAPAASAPRRG